MAAINSPDKAAAWAHRRLPAKNAKIVEERFQARLSEIDQQLTAGASRDRATARSTPEPADR
jgi:hypothetical protein